MQNDSSFHVPPPHKVKREFDQADIDGKPVENVAGIDTGPEPSVPGVPRSSPEEQRPPTEDDQDVELPDDGPSHYGEDVERDSDA
ncbi:hypothetical protein [Rhodanobacter sp. L36]|uniref:hypothetical protein n=1 Tax=Rhodanobacter sp. L36 TaxID=1747221 RepID=UPI00131C0C8F|nr:hypothetical protein [Rhodanobacter sp. L36]